MIPTNQPTENRLAFADGLRGIAALWVVLFHISEGHHIESIKAKIPSFLITPIFEWGHLGVAIFFVLSGFVMGLTAYNVVFDRQNALRFIGRRLLRLAPPYYFAIFFALFFLFIKSNLIGSEYSAPNLDTLLHHLLFTQGLFKTPFINVVFWTLCIEVQFYVAFALLLWASDKFNQVSLLPDIRFYTIAAISILALLWPLKIVNTSFWQGGFIGFWYSFLAGVLVCWASFQKELLLKFSISFCIGLLLIGIFYQASFVITSSITAATILFVNIKNLMGNWLNWPWLQWLGGVSYSLYLLHNPVTGATANIVKRIVPAGALGELIIMSVSIMACLTIALLSYMIIERPSIRISHLVKLKK